MENVRLHCEANYGACSCGEDARCKCNCSIHITSDIDRRNINDWRIRVIIIPLAGVLPRRSRSVWGCSVTESVEVIMCLSHRGQGKKNVEELHGVGIQEVDEMRKYEKEDRQQ
jgi:hypothetical protein